MNTFDISVNVGVSESVTFVLTYQEVLTRVHGLYKHVVSLPLPIEPPAITDVRVHVTINESRPITRVHVPAPAERLSDRNNRALAHLPAAVDGVRVTGERSGCVDVDFKPTTELTGNVQLIVL
jgi:hypothetical protein